MARNILLEGFLSWSVLLSTPVILSKSPTSPYPDFKIQTFVDNMIIRRTMKEITIRERRVEMNGRSSEVVDWRSEFIIICKRLE